MSGQYVFWVGATAFRRALVSGPPGAPLAMAALALACCAAAPAHALEVYDLSAYAEYSAENGTILLTPYLIMPNPGVDWSSIDAGKIRLVGCAPDGGCHEVPLSVRVAADFFGNNLLELSPDVGPEALAGASLTLAIGEGAYRNADDGAANVPITVPVVIPGERVEDLLEGAVYDHRTDELSLLFSDEVEPSSVDWGRIYLYGQILQGRFGFHSEPEPALVPMPEPDRFVGIDMDGRAVVFALGADARSALMSMYGPTLVTATGAYRGADGTVGQIGLFKGVAVQDDAYMAARTGLASAEYLAGENRLRLRFVEAVDPFSVDPGRMFIETTNVHKLIPEPFTYAPGSLHSVRQHSEMITHASASFGVTWTLRQSVQQHPEMITVSPSEFAGVSDLGTVIFELSESNRYTLSTIPDPRLFVYDGFLRWLEDGAEFVGSIIPVEITGGDFLPPDPGIPAGLPVGRVDYGGDDGMITLHFREPIDPSSVNASRIAISSSHPCIEITLEDKELVRVAADGGSATFEISERKNRSLMLLNNTWMSLETGAFQTIDGAPTGGGLLPFPDDPATIYGKSQVLHFDRTWLPCHITYAVESPADILEHYGVDPDDHLDRMISSVDEGLAVWSRLNPGLTLEKAEEGTADITVKWARHTAAWAGSSCSCFRPGEGMYVKAVYIPNSGEILVVHDNPLMNTVAHEFGHNLGLMHHKDREHLMFAYKARAEDPYNDLGLNIPDDSWWKQGG